MIQFKKRFKLPQQKWYHIRKGPKFPNKNGTISEKGSKFPNKNDTISEKGQNSLTKLVSFQKGAKFPQQKWYHQNKENTID